MELAKAIYQCLTNGSGATDILDILNRIKDKDTLAQINEFFMEQYNKTPNEFIAEKFKVEEVYAISSTLNCIRKPSSKNIKDRNRYYKKIGYPIPS